MNIKNFQSVWMKTRAIRASAILALVAATVHVQADNWNAPDHGYLIQINTPSGGIPQTSGSSTTLSGKVSFVPSPMDSSETASNLSDEMGLDGITLKLYFPDYTTEVTSRASLQPGNGYTAFNFQTPNLDPNSLNTLIVQVIHQSENFAQLQQTKSKIDQRVVILNQLILSLQGTTAKDDLQRLKSLTSTRDQLVSLSSKLATNLASANVVLSERKYPLQVANAVSQPSSSMMLMGGFRLEHSFDIGSAIQGESTTAHSKVTRVYSTNGTDKFYWITNFSWNGVQTHQAGPEQLGVGASESWDTPVSKADPSALNKLSVTVNRTNNSHSHNTKLYGTLDLVEPVALDSTPPRWASTSPSGNLGYVKSVSSFTGLLVDDFGLIDRSTFNARITGTTSDGRIVNQDWTSLFSLLVPDQGQSLFVSGDPVSATSLPEGTYKISLGAADLAGNDSSLWNTSFVLDHTPPAVQIGFNSGDSDAQLTRNPSFSFSLSVLDYSPVNATVLLNGQQVTSLTNQTKLSQTVTLTLAEGPNSIEIDATDAAGNAAAPIILTRILDTTPPVLSISQPKDGAVYTVLNLPISGSSNEPLSLAQVNGQNLTLSADQKSFSGAFAALSEGPTAIQITATDLAGNLTTVSSTPLIILKVKSLECQFALRCSRP